MAQTVEVLVASENDDANALKVPSAPLFTVPIVASDAKYNVTFYLLPMEIPTEPS